MNDEGKLKKEIYKTISESLNKLTPLDIKNKFLKESTFKKRFIKKNIKELVNENQIEYTYQYGRTFLEISFNKPVHISDRIIIKPPDVFYKANDNDIVVNLIKGSSFGSGTHPTTRLASKSIEYCFDRVAFNKKNSELSVIDIGTGNGILSIISVLMGADVGIGLDIDPVAINEAINNVRINHLEKKIKIENKSLNELNGTYSLVTANLRFPTLMNIYKDLLKITEKKSVLAFSGLKKNEEEKLLNRYTEKKFKCLLRIAEKKWSGIVLKRVI